MKIGRENIQFAAALFVILCGLVLMFMGFFAVPVGEISASVLTALGECFTFGGSLWGIERTYNYKTKKLEQDINKSERKNNRNNTDKMAENGDFKDE